jgi:hypothetical protein
VLCVLDDSALSYCNNILDYVASYDNLLVSYC